MNLRTLLSTGALIASVALPATVVAQRHYGNVRNQNYGSYGRTSYGYGRGPFGPSYIPGASSRYYGSGAPLRIGGATVYFGPGGGYGTTFYPYGFNGYGGYNNGYGYNGYYAPGYSTAPRYRNYGHQGYRYQGYRRGR